MFGKWKNRRIQSTPSRPAAPCLMAVTASEADREQLRRIVRSGGWEILTVGRLDEALELFRTRPTPVVLCDRDLPDVDWRQAIERFANGHGRPSVLLASFVADDYLWDEVIQHGGYDVVAKPFREDEVLHALRFAWAAVTRSLPSSLHTK